MSKIIKLLLATVAAFTTATVSTCAQSFINTPNVTIEVTGIMDDLETLSILQFNTTSDSIQLQWTKVSESVPVGWEASVCDNFTCNTSLVDDGTMLPVLPGEYGLLLIHITAHLNYGTAVIQYAIWDQNYPAAIDTLTYILHVNAPSSVGQVTLNEDYQLYPNPVSDALFIKSNQQPPFTYIIFNSQGKRMITKTSISDTDQLLTSDYPNGKYLVTIIDKNKKVSTKTILIQH